MLDDSTVGSGSGSVPRTNGSRPRRPKNIRIRIRYTGLKGVYSNHPLKKEVQRRPVVQVLSLSGDQLPELKLSSFSELDKRSMSATLLKHIKYLVGKEASKVSKLVSDFIEFIIILHFERRCFYYYFYFCFKCFADRVWFKTAKPSRDNHVDMDHLFSLVIRIHLLRIQVQVGSSLNGNIYKMKKIKIFKAFFLLHTESE